MPLTCGICPLALKAWDATSPDPACRRFVCSDRETLALFGTQFDADHECDVPVGHMRSRLAWHLAQAEKLKQAIAMREAEARA